MPSELSGGMARRVALARAIALDPMLIMYDEPFTGLDPISMGVISNLIRRLNDALGATSIVVTHDVQESLQDRRLRLLHVGRRRRRAGHAGRDPQLRRRRSCTSSCGARWTARCRSTTRARRIAADLALEPAACLSASASGLRLVGHRVVNGIWRLGYASRFFALTLAALRHELPPLPRLTIREIYFAGVLSLIIIIVSGCSSAWCWACRATRRCRSTARRRRSARWSRSR